MAYYSPKEMQEVLQQYPQYRDKLYCRGFLITTSRKTIDSDYPFYSNWSEQIIVAGKSNYFLYTHKDTYTYTYKDGEYTFFLVGHAYDPFNMITDENTILGNLAIAMKNGQEAYWDEESNLTGVFCTGYFTEKQVVYSTDCAGMQLVYHGSIEGNLYIASHSKLVADLTGLEQTKYIRRLVSNKFWHYWGTWLPGDLSPFDELKRMQPNCAVCFIMYIPRKRIKIAEFFEVIVSGFQSTIPALAIILFALVMRNALGDLNMPNYVVNAVLPYVNSNTFPAIAFAVVGTVAFFTGSNWGTPAICAPIILSVASACGANILLVMAAIACGGIFCSHACFYSDATILTSAACKIQNTDHAFTQLPYALISAGLSFIVFLIFGFII